MDRKVHPTIPDVQGKKTPLAPLGEIGEMKSDRERNHATGQGDSRRYSLMKDSSVKYLKAARIVYKDHSKPVVSLGVLKVPNEIDTFILSGSEDKTLKVWSLCTGQLIVTLKGHKQRLSGVVGHADAGNGCPPVAVTSSWDETLRIWPLESCISASDAESTVDAAAITAQSVQVTGFKNRVLGIALVCPEKGVPSVAGCSADNTIQVFRLPDGERLYVLEDKDEVTWNMCLESWYIPAHLDARFNGHILLSGCKTNIVRIWRAKPPPPHPDQSTKPDKVIRGAHASAVQKIGCFDYEDLPHLVTICRDLDIRIFSMLSGELLKTLRGHKSTITDLTAHDISTRRGGAIIVSSSVQGNMRVWKYSTGELMRVFNGHTEEIAAVTAFQTPEPDKDDLIIISGSKDQSARTWLFAEEKNLKVLPHRSTAAGRESNPLASPKSRSGKPVRVNAIDVYTEEAGAGIVTGADDGVLRAFRVSQADNDNTDDLIWSVPAHTVQIMAVVVYVPMLLDITSSNPLHHVTVVSACRAGGIRISSLQDGSEVFPMWSAHSSAVTSLCIFPGRPSVLGAEGKFTKKIDPFLVSGSEDNTAKVWSLTSNPADTCLYTLDEHEFDVTSVAVYYPRPREAPTRKERLKGNSRATSRAASRLASPRSSFLAQGAATTAEIEPIIITASIDTTICLWSYSTGEVLEALDDSKTFVTSLTIIDPKPVAAGMAPDPVLAAGNGDGDILIWSLKAPYTLRHTFSGHTDEVVTLASLDAEGLFPVLVSGSLDTTVRVWDARKLAHKITIEGHTDDVMAVKVFRAGDNDPALASGSSDASVRVLYDFLGNVPNMDVVKQQFKFDLEGTNSHIQMESSSSDWPRIAQLVKGSADTFFTLYYPLFGEALRAGRSDFLVEFLPTTRMGLLKSNSEMEDGTMEDNRGGLLRQAITLKDTIAVRVIIDCWCAFLTTPPESDTDLLYNTKLGTISMDDVLFLAEVYPAEFEKLICSVKLMPAQGNRLPAGALYMFMHKDKGLQIAPFLDESKAAHHGGKVHLLSFKGSKKDSSSLKMKAEDKYNTASRKEGEAVDGAPTTPNREAPLRQSMEALSRAGSILGDMLEIEGEDEEEKVKKMQGKNQTFLFLPLNGAVHMTMLKAYTDACQDLDSVEIFNSEAGQLALSYAWKTFGIKAHLKNFMIYLTYVAISTTSTLTFQHLRDTDYWIVSLVLIILQLLLNAYFMRSEAQQYLTNIIEYLEDIWNFIDFTIIITSTAGNVLRLIYWKDVPAALVTLCLASIFIWFNILYYLRAFESTGPLVSMIIKIAGDINYLIFVVLLVLVGFSQAFYLLSEEDDDLPFGRIDHSFLNSFSFMLGGYDPEGFSGVNLEGFALFLSTIYMLIVSILLLNLLIALMGDSYGAVKEKGLAQWKYEQALIITEMQGSMTEKDRTSEAVVYYRKKTDEMHEHSDDDPNEVMTAALTEIVEQKHTETESSIQKVNKDVLRLQDEVVQMREMIKELLDAQQNR